MRRRAVEVVVQFLDVLPVITLAVGQAEETLLQTRVPAVPQSQRKAPVEAVVAEAGDAVLAPAVRAAAGVVVRKERPGIAIGGIVLAHGSPLPVSEVGTPAQPRLPVREAPAFGGREHAHGCCPWQATSRCRDE